MSSIFLAFSSIKIKSGPTAPVKRRTLGSKTSLYLTSYNVSFKDMEISVAIQRDSCLDYQAAAMVDFLKIREPGTKEGVAWCGF
ncbi:hypothetical protein TNCV_2263321 [Trichonephila clavipes]|nr:hypothetical protein TNCV_2263321 [Trichonephila clavipes]